ncbi:hypothetical protein DFH06DRAFT_627771 [Mycena polygramma]|nr:hypothetical protein DFH06DRAFT_627771 [Mycena polygramma]
MLKRMAKWPRKRPREPGRTNSESPVAQESPRPARRRFQLFVKKRLETQESSQAQSTTSEPSQTQVSALDVATPASKILLYVCEAPPLGVLKPLAGLANHACEMFQAVRSYKEATERLEKQAVQVEHIINNLGDPMSPQFMEILHILEEIRCFLDSADSVTAKPARRQRLRLWLIAAREQDRARALSERLRDTVSVLIRPLLWTSNYFQHKTNGGKTSQHMIR